MLAPIYAIFIKKIGGSILDAGLTIGCYAILKGVLYFIFRGLKEGKFSRKLMISLGYCLFFVAYVLYMFAANVWFVLGIQAILAIAEVIINPSWSAVIANALEQGKERRIYSDFYGYRSIFEGIAAIAGGVLASSLGFDVLFGLMAGLALSAGILALFLKD